MRVRIIEPIKTITRKRVCAYARVSSESEAQGDSLENQTAYYKQLFESNPEYEFIGIFADRATTGTKEQRPEFQKMLALAREHKIDRILTKSISRFARNTMIVLEVVRELKSLGVEIIFEKENISSFDGDGELLLTVLSSFAQEESKNISDNIKWRYKRNFEQGQVAINTTRFLGYDKDQYGDLVINRTQAEIVERIFNDCVNGKGAFVIAQELQNEGVPTITGSKWHSSTILNILRNEKYKGDVKLQKTYSKDHLSKKKCINRGEVDSYYIEDNHSPIVTREVWDEAQSQIGSRIRGNVDKMEYQNRYPLTGMLFCSKCGNTLRRRTWNSKHDCKKIVWQCSTYINEGKNSCLGTAIEDEVIARMNIQNKTVIKETMRNGQKHYSYTCKG
ncbi:recombinase family protein [Pelosinus sp. sgz500959]|uniref:recombinase family protein n=1 Tax=Pelosinus sp. sgz500959 TaxID=3242472 RepID=UPI003672C8D6